MSDYERLTNAAQRAIARVVANCDTYSGYCIDEDLEAMESIHRHASEGLAALAALLREGAKNRESFEKAIAALDNIVPDVPV